MNLRTLKNAPTWDWPEDTGRMLLDVLRDGRSSESDLLLATDSDDEDIVTAVHEAMAMAEGASREDADDDFNDDDDSFH